LLNCLSLVNQHNEDDTLKTDKRFILTPERPDRLCGPSKFYRLRTECCFYGSKTAEASGLLTAI